jgi:hypothetical protein
MADATQLVRDGKIDPAALERLSDGQAILQALGATAPESIAAGALAAGRTQARAAIPALSGLLMRDGVAGRAAAWALAQLGAEAELLAAVDGAKLDARENGYWGLMVLAARGAGSAGLAAELAARVEREIERARSGGTGLGEHACRVLAILGAPGVDGLIQRVIEQDRFCDRFELQRLRKSVQDGGRDQESVRELSAPYGVLFAKHIVGAEAPEAPAASPSALVTGAGAPAAKAAPPVAKKAPPAKGPAAPGAAAPPPGDVELEDQGQEPGAPASQPVDWKAFIASPEATALPPQSRSLIAQLGPVLEQLALRAVQAPLTDLSGQEFAGLLLQVLPQAIPQQAVQAALSPQALNAYQAMVRYFMRAGLATHGEEMLQGVKLVRRELSEQIRRSGILGGPDYSDPDEPKPKVR